MHWSKVCYWVCLLWQRCKRRIHRITITWYFVARQILNEELNLTQVLGKSAVDANFIPVCEHRYTKIIPHGDGSVGNIQIVETITGVFKKPCEFASIDTWWQISIFVIVKRTRSTRLTGSRRACPQCGGILSRNTALACCWGKSSHGCAIRSSWAWHIHLQACNVLMWIQVDCIYELYKLKQPVTDLRVT